MVKLFLALGSINMALAVALGAFGAHGLQSILSDKMMNTYTTGVEYHFYHALGLLAVGLLALHIPDSGWLKSSGWLMFTGILLFSGSLYLLSIFDIRWLGAITPIGGICFITGWIFFAVAVFQISS